MTNELDSCIHVSQLELMVRIGVPDEERAGLQRLAISLTLWPLNGCADLSDDLKRTVELRKFILRDVEFVSVTVTRERPGD